MNRLWIIILVLLFSTPGDAQLRTEAIEAYNEAVPLLNGGQCDRAVALLRKAVRLAPEEVTFRRGLAICLMETGQHEAALQEFRRVVEADPDDHEAFYQIGYIYSEIFQDLEQALPYYERAAQLQPVSTIYQKTLGLTYERLGQLDNARRVYEDASRRQNADEWVEKRLSANQPAAYRVKYRLFLSNNGRSDVRKLHLWVSVARDFPPHQATEFVAVHPPVTQLVQDSVGNPLAYFAFEDVPSGWKQTVEFDYRVQINPTMYHLQPGMVYLADYDRTKRQISHYCQPERFVEVDHPQIQAKMRELTRTSGSDAIRAMREIYDFVRLNLPYTIAERTHGALYALSGGSETDCSEFSALFTALSRAYGVPTRQVHGYLHQPDAAENTAHAWAEIYLPKGQWVPIDPTSGRDSPEQFFGNINSIQIGMWTPSRLLEGHDHWLISEYREDQSMPEIDSDVDYQIEVIPLWRNADRPVPESSLDLPVVTSLEEVMQISPFEKRSAVTPLTLIFLGIAFVPMLVVVALKFKQESW